MTLAMDIVDDDDASLEELQGAPFHSGKYVASEIGADGRVSEFELFLGSLR